MWNNERIFTETSPPIFPIQRLLNFLKKTIFIIFIVTLVINDTFLDQGVPKIAILRKNLGHPVVIFLKCELN